SARGPANETPGRPGSRALRSKWQQGAGTWEGLGPHKSEVVLVDRAAAVVLVDPALGWWEAELPVPLWGGQLPVLLDAPAAGPSARQVATLRAVLAYPESLRGPIAEALLAHYRDDWGCVTPSLGPAPLLRSADEVWPALSAFALYIPAFRSEVGGVAFEVHMD